MHDWVCLNNKVAARTQMPDIRCPTQSTITTSTNPVVSAFKFTYRFPLGFTKYYIYMVLTITFE